MNIVMRGDAKSTAYRHVELGLNEGYAPSVRERISVVQRHELKIKTGSIRQREVIGNTSGIQYCSIWRGKHSCYGADSN